MSDDLTINDQDKQAIQSIVDEWLSARGCGTIKDRLNAALDNIEADPKYHAGHFHYAFALGKQKLGIED
ncbi:MAG: hypothetical protein HOM11_08425 [Methylococcales bacterium]|jgi:hypothetical protein|nr:hypothetical protein [Methylococcales bacterium]MBT7446022.1 hypothetical protein [Methylococcales bacterium]